MQPTPHMYSLKSTNIYGTLVMCKTFGEVLQRTVRYIRQNICPKGIWDLILAIHQKSHEGEKCASRIGNY